MFKVAFSKMQLAQFSRQVHARCERRIGDLLIACFAEAGELPRQQLDAFVRRCCATAERFGLTSERGAATFVALSWLHGEDFHTRFFEVEAGLADERRSCAEKVSLLSRHLTPVHSDRDDERPS